MKTKVEQFRDAHKNDKPLILLNIWNVESAKALSEVGIKLLPTGSYAISDFYGYQDGENIPLTELLSYVSKMDTKNNFVTVDIESGYGTSPTDLNSTIEQVVASGAIGINIEDKIANTTSLFSVKTQKDRLLPIKNKLIEMNKDLFINVRTDMYFVGDIIQNNQDEQLLKQTIERINSYEKTGIDGIFIPGLKNKEHIKRIVQETRLPINLMLDIQADRLEDYLDLGISRISYGPSLYFLYNEQSKDSLVDFYRSLLKEFIPYEEQGKIELFRQG
ncbi:MULTISPECIES: isocitrate lyase/PEP mutase family protein [unclassified Enterococcus]|uniref:isocitrate lyase/PEP mutase family protein n=1 Tax=unclassified Enterococcus TaxID=2608891 RepID=UPI001CE0CE8A|nr:MULTISPECIES: isocitrate lyase/phosphoenolpyruvate mutase family protein [unclassified Enterococcus]MCA5014302.1 isocitrate lyase/phosphoenolpyruvate mutase family protein [Enterococcus sp. S23]MCA5017713.1 isocitrate lyase/phosphoenolpyruvate mutase family protein [Enterococcus sp. S22(2020)]